LWSTPEGSVAYFEQEPRSPTIEEIIRLLPAGVDLKRFAEEFEEQIRPSTARR
jgi:hypothetical protein